jgi:hypothetical protein
MFLIHNTAHHPKTRLIRAQAPVHPRHKQFILKSQRRLIPNRPVEIEERELAANLEELRKLEKQGILEVRTKAGRLVNLHTFDVESDPAEAPKPNFPDQTLHNAPPRGKSKSFIPDTTEEITVKLAEHAGGGMTEEAMAQADEDAQLPPLPPELQHLDDPAPAVEAVAMEQDEEAEIVHVEAAPRVKTRSRRR